jgi:hypothetical protein
LPRHIIREELVVLTRMYTDGRAGRDLKPLCLALIDRVAGWATERHGEIPADVLAKLVAAMIAAGKEDVVGVVAEVEQALTLAAKVAAKPPPCDAPAPARRREGRPRPDRGPGTRMSEVAPIVLTVDRLLARLRAKGPKT